MSLASLARHGLEKASRGLVRKRRLPESAGGQHLFVSSAGGLRLLFGGMEAVDAELMDTARLLAAPGATVWDVGANLGLFTFAAAGLTGSGGKVFAIEPDVSLVALLRRSCLLSDAHAAPVTVVPCGAAGTTGLRTFAIARRARASNALAEFGNSQMGGVMELQTIVCASPDLLLDMLPKPDSIKIDIEGAELEFLAHAGGLLGEVRPVLAIEVGAENAATVSEILAGHGYSLFDGARGFYEGEILSLAPWNTIAVPEEKIEHVRHRVLDRADVA